MFWEQYFFITLGSFLYVFISFTEFRGKIKTPKKISVLVYDPVKNLPAFFSYRSYRCIKNQSFSFSCEF